MIKLSVSKVARMLGLKRKDVQKQINAGTLQTHEGYVATDSVRLAYPQFKLCSEQDNHIKKINNIKIHAQKKISDYQKVCSKNEEKLIKCIDELYKQNQQYIIKIHKLEQIIIQIKNK